MNECTVVSGGLVVTMGPQRVEHREGYLVVEAGRIAAVGAGPAPDIAGAQVVDTRGCVITPGLVNTHHHLYQWVTRGLAVDATLFEWLTELYPVWGCLDEETVAAAATAGLGWLARTGCTTSMDHHYVFPAGAGDLLGAEVEAARTVGLRFMPTRGSMDLGRSAGGLPPDHVVEGIDAILASTADAVDRFHDPSPDAVLRLGVAPCSPFTVTDTLLTESAALARDRGVRLHTHLAETLDEDTFCRERFGCGPVEYMESLGWVGDDVWFGHGIHLDDGAIRTMASTQTGVAHCPSSNARLGAGIARVRDLRDAGVPVGIGVDGAASNEANSLLEEARHALLFARAQGGPKALTVRDALEVATIGGAQVLGWDEQIGSLEIGKQADLAVWRVDGLAHADVVDPVAGLILGDRPPLDLLMVAGRPVVRHDRLVRVDEDALTARSVRASQALLARAGVIS